MRTLYEDSLTARLSVLQYCRRTHPYPYPRIRAASLTFSPIAWLSSTAHKTQGRGQSQGAFDSEGSGDGRS